MKEVEDIASLIVSRSEPKYYILKFHLKTKTAGNESAVSVTTGDFATFSLSISASRVFMISFFVSHLQ